MRPLTVRGLIELLAEMPSDAPVVVYSSEDDEPLAVVAGIALYPETPLLKAHIRLTYVVEDTSIDFDS